MDVFVCMAACATVIYLQGGADSFNMLIPHSNCAGRADLYAAYAAVRGDVALPLGALHPFTVSPSGSQPCDTFGMHTFIAHGRSHTIFSPS